MRPSLPASPAPATTESAERCRLAAGSTWPQSFVAVPLARGREFRRKNYVADMRRKHESCGTELRIRGLSRATLEETQTMADDRFRNDPYRPLGDNDTLGAVRQDARLQPDPELGEGPASSGKIALFAVAIALVLGALFYGLNNTSVNQATTDTTTRSAQTQT